MLNMKVKFWRTFLKFWPEFRQFRQKGSWIHLNMYQGFLTVYDRLIWCISGQGKLREINCLFFNALMIKYAIIPKKLGT